ncbi:MAG: EamA family transporter [Candidatus Parcubacteria bacterium]|nr:EamA family transporter [Candidatus Parcubacteria bacterium]
MWLVLAVIAYLLFALANIGDKLVVSKYKTEPIVYAFYVGILGIVSVWLIPFGVYWLPGFLFVLALLAGVAFVAALFFMYKALSLGETSKAITIMGSSSPIFTFTLANIFLHEQLKLNEIIAFIILVAAIILIVWQKQNKSRKKYHDSIMFWSVLAGFGFAANYILTKYLFSADSFVNIFFWTRIGGFITALVILLFAQARKLIKADWKRPKKQKGLLVLGIQLAGGLGVILQSYALSLASATLINALQAVQYALVFIFASILGRKNSHLAENINRQELIRKISALLLIAIGLSLLALSGSYV